MSYLTPDQADASQGDDITDILGLGQNATKQDRLALQMKLANALRTGSVSQGTSVPQGSQFLPNTLQTAMNQFDHIQGIVAQAQGKKQGDTLDAERSKGLAHFAKMWFKNQSSGTDPNNPQGPPSSDQGGYGDDDSSL